MKRQYILTGGILSATLLLAGCVPGGGEGAPQTALLTSTEAAASPTPTTKIFKDAKAMMGLGELLVFCSTPSICGSTVLSEWNVKDPAVGHLEVYTDGAGNTSLGIVGDAWGSTVVSHTDPKTGQTDYQSDIYFTNDPNFTFPSK